MWLQVQLSHDQSQYITFNLRLEFVLDVLNVNEPQIKRQEREYRIRYRSSLSTYG